MKQSIKNLTETEFNEARQTALTKFFEALTEGANKHITYDKYKNTYDQKITEMLIIDLSRCDEIIGDIQRHLSLLMLGEAMQAGIRKGLNELANN